MYSKNYFIYLTKKTFFHMIRSMVVIHVLFPLMVVIHCGKSQQQLYRLPIDITNIRKN